jgi:prophage regulatory protein
MNEDKLIPIDKVIERVGLGRTFIYNKMEKGEFPKPQKLSRKAVRWSNNAVSEYIASPTQWKENHASESM